MFYERFSHHIHTPENDEHATPETAVESGERASARAEEIAGEGNYAQILDTLRREGLLPSEMKRVVREYALADIAFLNEADKEMFAVLDLYDPGTARHCLETYQIARGKMEKEIMPGVSFARLIEKQENVSLDQFYRACLFHDIGKVEVPRVVIRHHMDDGHMLECMHHVYHMLYHDGKIPEWLHLKEDATDEEIDHAFSAQHTLRCNQLIPAREVLSPSDLEEVQRRGYTGEETLMDIIKPHETHSGEILANAGYPVESEIAALHHNYDAKKSERPLAVSVLHMNVDLSDMLHIADVMQALRSGERTYKGSFSQPKAMRIITEHAQEGKVSLLSAYLWLSDDLHKYEEKPPMDAKEREQDERHLAFVRAFLAHAEEEVQVLEAA
ncbi:MAG: hypothetical protein WA053_01545 [Minisyncoccia bacterium]